MIPSSLLAGGPGGPPPLRLLGAGCSSDDDDAVGAGPSCMMSRTSREVILAVGRLLIALELLSSACRGGWTKARASPFEVLPVFGTFARNERRKLLLPPSSLCRGIHCGVSSSKAIQQWIGIDPSQVREENGTLSSCQSSFRCG